MEVLLFAFICYSPIIVALLLAGLVWLMDKAGAWALSSFRLWRQSHRIPKAIARMK